MAKPYVSPPLALEPPAAPDFRRADIEFEGIDHSGPSYEARVFLNNPSAGAQTPMTPEQGYAGSFHVYGFGLPPERVAGRSAAAAPPGDPEARTPSRRFVVATDAVRRAAAQGRTVTVTVVPVVNSLGLASDRDDLLHVDRVSIVFYN